MRRGYWKWGVLAALLGCVPPAGAQTAVPAGRKAQGKSLAEWCHDTNQTPEQLKAKIPDMLRWNAYVQPRLTPAVVERCYRDNKDYFDGVTVHARHIVFRLPAGTPEDERQ